MVGIQMSSYTFNPSLTASLFSTIIRFMCFPNDLRFLSPSNSDPDPDDLNLDDDDTDVA